MPNDIKEHQAAAWEHNKKEAAKQKAKSLLKLDERDIDDTMNAKIQQEIYDKIRQNRGSGQIHPGSGTHSQGGNPGVYQGSGETNAQQNLQNFHGGSEHLANQSVERNVQPYSESQPSILRAGEMKPPRPQMEPSHPQMDPSRPQNQPPILRAETDDRNQVWPQQPNQYYPQPNDPQYAHMGGGYPQATGSAHQMQANQHPYPPRAQHYDPYRQQEMLQYQGSAGVGGNAYMPTSGGGGGTGYPPYSSAPYQPPHPIHPGNYHIQQPNNIPAQPIPINPYNLEVGSVVYYGDNPNFTGVIKVIYGHMAGVEMVS